MTQDKIIQMARKAWGNSDPSVDSPAWRYNMVRFADLVVAAKDAEHQQTLALQQRSYEREIQLEVEAERERIGDQCAEQIKAAIEDEREACARAAETYEVASGMNGAPHIAMIFKDCAAAIRARGNT